MLLPEGREVIFIKDYEGTLIAWINHSLYNKCCNNQE